MVIQSGIYIFLFVSVLLETVCIASCQRFRDCQNGSAVKPLPRTATNTTVRLKNLRSLFRKNGIDAYIIPAVDEHQSEYVAPQAKRRQFISGFSGSAGLAIVTGKKAALWTDGRYFEQAEMQLDCNWILQKAGQPGVPSQDAWLSQEVQSGKSVGIDPRLISIASWKSRSETLKRSGIELKPIIQNLIDEVWTNKPKPKDTKLSILDVKYTGATWQSKITKLREKMKEKKATVMVLSSLDEVAWILCLRGKDIPYNPFYFAYIIVTNLQVRLFVDQRKVTPAVSNHLCPDASVSEFCVKIFNYTSLRTNLLGIMASSREKLWISPRASYLLQWGINDTNIILDYSPVQLMKSMKNDVEIKGMKSANLKDAVAIVEFFAWLEKQVKKGVHNINELEASAKLKEFKSKQKDFKDLSFETISAFGPNGAVIHYRPSKETALNITDKGLYLVDSGCQFLEGTTDITRTVHFGNPTPYEKEAYTSVLRGAIRLAMAIFPPGVFGRHLDVLARSLLWNRGLGYNHGTGHGIGHYLSVHEGPQSIGRGRIGAHEKPLHAGMVQSDEPGYYETGKFGIRLETAILTVNATTKYQFGGKQFLGFEPISLVPFQKELIDIEMLDDVEIKWINDFHAKSRRVLGSELKRQGKMDGYEWLTRYSEPLHKAKKTSKAHSVYVAPSLLFIGYQFAVCCSIRYFYSLF